MTIRDRMIDALRGTGSRTYREQTVDEILAACPEIAALDSEPEDCPVCNGGRDLDGLRCPTCKGSGKLVVIVLTVPA